MLGAPQRAPTMGRDTGCPHHSFWDLPRHGPCSGWQRGEGGFSLCPLSLCHADPVPAPVTAPSALPQIPRLSPCPSNPRRCRRARGSCSPAWRPPTPRSKATGEGPPGGPFPTSWLGFSIVRGRGQTEPWGSCTPPECPRLGSLPPSPPLQVGQGGGDHRGRQGEQVRHAGGLHLLHGARLLRGAQRHRQHQRQHVGGRAL